MRRKLNVKLVAGLLGACALTAIAVHFLHGYQLSENSYRLRERGDRALEAKEYEKARSYYEKYRTFVPNDADTATKYAQALDQSAASVGERVQLVLLMEQVLRVRPTQHELRFRLVHHLIALDRIGEAIANLKVLQNHWPDKAEVLHMLGWCHEAKREYLAAVQAFEAAIALDPKRLETYALLAEVLQSRQPDQARRVMDDMVEANPDSYKAYLSRARFTRRSGDEKKAQNDLQAAYKLAPDRPEVILELADAARAQGNWEEAVKLLQHGLKRFPDNAAFYRDLAWVNILTEKRAAAIVILQDGLRNAPKSNELAILMIDLMIDEKQYDQASKKIDDLLRAGLKPALPNYLKARLSIADRRWNEAIQLLESTRQDLGAGSEWSSRINALLGLCYRQIGDREQELQAFRRAVQDEPTWMTACVGLGAALLDNGRVEEAIQALEPLHTAKDLPAGYWILLSRARLYRQLRVPTTERRLDDVEEALTEAARVEPKSVEIATMRAEMLAARGDFAGARAELEKTRTERPDDVTVWCALADLSARQNRFDEAEKILAEAAGKSFGDDVELRLARCRLWGARGGAEEKAKLIQLGTNLPAAWSVEDRARLDRELADTWHRLGDWERADQLWREVAKAVPGDLRSRSMLLDLALSKNQVAPARTWLEEIRKIEGDQGWLWRFGAIAILVQDAHGRPSQLAEARTKLVELEKSHKNWPRIPLLSARIFELEGKYPEAIQEYIRALDMGEIQPRMMARLLELLVQRREYSKAEAELAKYEQKVPLTPELARLGTEVALGMRDKQYARLALKRAEKAIDLPVRDYRDALWLARVYQAAGETAKTEQLLRESLDLAGHTPDTWIAWMEYLAATNQRALGLQELERLKKELPKSRQPLTIARCYEALQLPDQAAIAYQAALNADADDFIALARAADFYRRTDQADKAVELYERLLAPDLAAPAEYTIAARRRLAVLLASRDNAAAREQALTLLDDNRHSRGDTLADQRIRLFIQSATPSAQRDAIDKFQGTLPLAPPTPDERFLLARMLESANQLGQARSQYVEMVDEVPLATQYLVRYARLLIRTGELDDAERQLARLQTLEPNSARVREVRAAFNRAKGQTN